MARRTHVEGKKFDRLLSPAASAAAIRCDYAAQPFFRLEADMDRKWGINRLPGLVTPALAEKFGRAAAHLNDCMNREDPEQTAAAAANCIRGMQAMDREAGDAGHEPASPEIWITEVDGKIFAFIRQADMWQAAQEAAPGAIVCTIREAAFSLGASNLPMLAEVKKNFPGAQINTIRQRTELQESLNDEIPW